MRRSMLLVVLLEARCAFAEAPRGGVSPMPMAEPRGWARATWGGGPSPRRFASVTRTGAGVVLFGGVDPQGPLADPWRWSEGAWHPLAAVDAPTPRAGHVAVWSGGHLCVWGGAAGRALRGDGACWDPVTDRWRAISGDGAPTPRRRAGAVAIGQEMVVFGGLDAEGEALGDGARYDPVADRWTPLPDGGPAPRADATLVARGQRVAVLGGVGEALALGADDAAWFDLGLDAWQQLRDAGGPLAREGAVWATGAATTVALGERAWRFDEGGGWTPAGEGAVPTRRWSASACEVPEGVVIWGGIDGARLLNDGARYDAATDRWTPLPSSDAPPPRQDALCFYADGALHLLWGSEGDALRTDAFTLPWDGGG